jgi:hypothetical protein
MRLAALLILTICFGITSEASARGCGPRTKIECINGHPKAAYAIVRPHIKRHSYAPAQPYVPPPGIVCASRTLSPEAWQRIVENTKPGIRPYWCVKTTTGLVSRPFFGPRGSMCMPAGTRDYGYRGADGVQYTFSFGATPPRNYSLR